MSFPLRLTLGYAMLFTDAPQAPVVAAHSLYTQVSGLFQELGRSGTKQLYPFNACSSFGWSGANAANQHLQGGEQPLNKLGRVRKFGGEGFRFGQ